MFKLIKDLFKGILSITEESQEVTVSYEVTDETLDLIKKYEGYKANAYEDVVGVWTIGYGNTFYEDGTKVKAGDKVTKARAEQLLRNTVNDFAEDVDNALKVHLTPCQFGALVSFTYNVGISAFKRSTLLKKVNANPNDKTIAQEFMKWTKAGGKVLAGLTRRRKEESEFYFKENC